MNSDVTALVTAWAGVATAFFTAILSLGVFVAAWAYRAQTREMRIVETGRILDHWRADRIRKPRFFVDRNDDHQENRTRIVRFYKHVQGLKRRYRKLHTATDEAILMTSALAERTEIYIRKNVADEGIIVEHIGYTILAYYYHLQDVLQIRAEQLNLDCEGWRCLAMRVQDYAKLHRKETGLQNELVWAEIPPIRYNDGLSSEPHVPHPWRRLKLMLVKRPGAMSA